MPGQEDENAIGAARHPVVEDPSRSWGERLRVWREEVKGWSRQELVENAVATAFRNKEDDADRLDVSRVKRWETGKTRNPQARYRRILAHMGAPLPPLPARCTLRTPPESPPETSALLPSSSDHDEWQPSPSAAEVISQVTRRDLSLKRRELGKLFASGTIYAVVP